MTDNRSMLVEDGLEILTEEECVALVAGEDVGRVALSIEAMPAIFPVNYRTFGTDIVFRTGDGLKRRAILGGSVLGFEVDHIDRALKTGWSVLMVGLAHELDPTDPALQGLDVSPWAKGQRSRVIRLHPEFISGRRIGQGV
jgi:uncharacterized protein